jgi:hypothetical protein
LFPSPAEKTNGRAALRQCGYAREKLGRCHTAIDVLECVAAFEEVMHEGAGDEIRTRDSLLGGQVLYQLSYSRVAAVF